MKVKEKMSKQINGYSRVTIPDNSSTNIDSQAYPLSGFTPIDCGGCNMRFRAKLFEIWRQYWVTSPVINYDGDQSMEKAWIACDKYQEQTGQKKLGRCCRQKLMTFVPFDLLCVAYQRANAMLPSDWAYDMHIACAGKEDEMKDNETGNDEEKSDGNFIAYTTNSVSASRSFYQDPHRYRLYGDI